MTNTTEEMDLLAPIEWEALEPVEVPVKVNGVRYILREGRGDVAARYKNAQMRAARINPTGGVTLEGAADVDVLLVSLCLYEAPDGRLPLNRKGEPDLSKLVPEHVIRDFPTKLIRTLYERAKEISGLTEDEDTIPVLEKKIERLTTKLNYLRAVANGAPSGPKS